MKNVVSLTVSRHNNGMIEHQSFVGSDLLKYTVEPYGMVCVTFLVAGGVKMKTVYIFDVVRVEEEAYT